MSYSRQIIRGQSVLMQNKSGYINYTQLCSNFESIIRSNNEFRSLIYRDLISKSIHIDEDFQLSDLVRVRYFLYVNHR